MPNYKFEVRLENVELSKSLVKEINTAVSAAAGKAVIKAGIGRDGALGSKLRLNPEWLGIWLRRFKDIDALKLSKTFKAAGLK
jgi:hypothetical protein